MQYGDGQSFLQRVFLMLRRCRRRTPSDVLQEERYGVREILVLRCFRDERDDVNKFLCHVHVHSPWATPSPVARMHDLKEAARSLRNSVDDFDRWVAERERDAAAAEEMSH